MSNDNQAKTIGAQLRELVEASKAPGADLEKLYASAEAGILRTVPDRPLAVGGRVLQPVEPHNMGTPLLDWNPDNEQTRAGLDQTLSDTKQRVSGRDRNEKKGPDR